MKRNSVFLFVMIAFTLSACATPMTQTQKGAAVGTGVGAATGALLGQSDRTRYDIYRIGRRSRRGCGWKLPED
jgi:hypothetical protein